MALVDVVRSGVKIAAGLTRSFQATVTHAAWIGQAGSGADAFAAPVSRQALVDRTVKPLYAGSGKLIMVVASVTFLDPIPNTTPNPGQQRLNPIDPRDVITLDDGTTAPIVRSGGFEDAGQRTPFVNEVLLGQP